DREQYGGGREGQDPPAARQHRRGGEAGDGRPGPGPQRCRGHHARTACANPPPLASASRITATTATIGRARPEADPTRASAPRSTAISTTAAHSASCQPTNNHGDPRQVVAMMVVLSVEVTTANGANSRSTTFGVGSGSPKFTTVTRLIQTHTTRNASNPAPAN